ncbi:MAG TPA: methylated-DNA--[protein]-cysteine S-methyltransferase [Rubrivivax sp.]|nr:methylated-DNA--[protein]-cysteine S-methyltransferase [Rubrivivax sp.]
MKTNPYAKLRGARIVACADIETPLGTMSALATAKGLAALWFDARKRDRDGWAAHGADAQDGRHPAIAAARRWLQAYWAGEDPTEIEVPLDLHGTPLQQAVWTALRAIPYGRTRSYGEVAAACGLSRTAAARATGAACGANPVGLIVPCHRVLGAKGALTGFSAGIERKIALLRHEGALLA